MQPAAQQKQGVRTWIGHTHSRTKARAPSHAHLTPEAAAPTATASSQAEARGQDVDRTHAQPYQGTWSVARTPDPRSSSTHSNSQQPSRSKESGRGSDTRTAVPRHVHGPSHAHLTPEAAAPGAANRNARERFAPRPLQRLFLAKNLPPRENIRPRLNRSTQLPRWFAALWTTQTP